MGEALQAKIKELLARALRAKDLAALATDTAIAANLRSYATELEVEAAALTVKQKMTEAEPSRAAVIPGGKDVPGLGALTPLNPEPAAGPTPTTDTLSKH